MKRIVIGAALVAVGLVGCKTVNQNDGGNSCLRPPVIKDGVHLKYEIGQQKISGQDQLNCLFGFICWGSTASHVCDQSEFSFGGTGAVKNGAYANACDAGKCDQIVGARYKITTDDYFVFKKIRAEVTGFPAIAVSAEVVDALKYPALVTPVPAPAAVNFKIPGLPF